MPQARRRPLFHEKLDPIPDISASTAQAGCFAMACIDNVYTRTLQYVYTMRTHFQKANAMRDAAINLRALPEERDLIDHAASLLGKNRSDFMLEVACERARAVVLEQTFFTLDADKFAAFSALLDAPPAPNQGLDRLMKIDPPWTSALLKSN
jgi:uncharacterized protein (DUF1778 family)